MSVRTWRAVAITLGCALAMLVPPHGAHAQPLSVQVTPPPGGDTLASVTPTFVVRAVGAGAGPLRFRFEIDTDRRFARPLLDTLITTGDSTITVRPTRALNGGAQIYWRARVLSPAGAETVSPIGGPRRVPPWITPLEPTGSILYDRRPRFVWRSPQVGEPPGPWEYDVEITYLGRSIHRVSVRDTAYQLPPGAELETNASYSATIAARLPRTGQSEFVSTGSFTVLDSAVVPTSTLVYQNFPNPFPSAQREATCIWLDVARATRAKLEIWSLRGMRVRRLLPNAALGEILAEGRYGREPPGSGRGCDERFEWDGRDDRGDFVPAGVYLLRFMAEGNEPIVRKILFRGR